MGETKARAFEREKEVEMQLLEKNNFQPLTEKGEEDKGTVEDHTWETYAPRRKGESIGFKDKPLYAGTRSSRVDFVLAMDNLFHLKAFSFPCHFRGPDIGCDSLPFQYDFPDS